MAHFISAGRCAVGPNANRALALSPGRVAGVPSHRHYPWKRGPGQTQSKLLATACLFGCLTALGLTSCKNPAPPPAPALRPPHDPTERESLPSEPSPFVDICRHPWGLFLVCGLHESGEVSCAKPSATQFDAPLPSFENIVALDCGSRSTCGLDGEGNIHCLGLGRDVGVIEGMGPAHSLAGDCAIGKDQQLYCWGETFVAKPTPLPETSQLADRGPLTDLVQAWFYSWPPENAGCALQSDGRLWCWMDGDMPMAVDMGEPVSINSHTEERRYEPYLVASIDDAESVTELEMLEQSLCWRGPEGWSCIDEQGEVEPEETCDTRPCTCTFPCPRTDEGRPCERLLDVSCRATDGAPPASEWVLPNVTQYDRWCVLNVEGEVWCQGAGRSLPPHRIHDHHPDG